MRKWSGICLRLVCPQIRIPNTWLFFLHFSFPVSVRTFWLSFCVWLIWPSPVSARFCVVSSCWQDWRLWMWSCAQPETMFETWNCTKGVVTHKGAKMDLQSTYTRSRLACPLLNETEDISCHLEFSWKDSRSMCLYEVQDRSFMRHMSRLRAVVTRNTTRDLAPKGQGTSLPPSLCNVGRGGGQARGGFWG